MTNKSNINRNNNLKDEMKNRNLKMNARTSINGIQDRFVVMMQCKGFEYFKRMNVEAIFANDRQAYEKNIKSRYEISKWTYNVPCFHHSAAKLRNEIALRMRNIRVQK